MYGPIQLQKRKTNNIHFNIWETWESKYRPCPSQLYIDTWAFRSWVRVGWPLSWRVPFSFSFENALLILWVRRRWRRLSIALSQYFHVVAVIRGFHFQFNFDIHWCLNSIFWFEFCTNSILEFFIFTIVFITLNWFSDQLSVSKKKKKLKKHIIRLQEARWKVGPWRPEIKEEREGGTRNFNNWVWVGYSYFFIFFLCSLKVNLTKWCLS